MKEVNMNTEKYGVLGATLCVPDLRDYVGKSTRKSFPDEFEIKNMPKVKSQGNVSSCVAHALATVTEYFNERESGESVEMSTGYIYGNRLLSLHKGSGMMVRDALKTLSRFGNIPHTCCPYNEEVPRAIQRFESLPPQYNNLGVYHKINSYYRLKSDDAIKSQLMDGNLVIFSMRWFDDITFVNGIMVTNQKKTYKTGRHCMVIYGWNSTGWLVQNSWGEHWCNSGKFVLPYNIDKGEVWGVTDANSTTSLEIEPPFRTKFGESCAKIIHKILYVGYNIFNKIKLKLTNNK